jgi:riboflavin biosynthesis pyrimidine reductase
MRALLPEPAASVDIVEAYTIPEGVGEHRAFVRCNMISSIDGAISVNGRSGMLGGPADSHLFHVLRSLADVILVGAGTYRAEGYGPVRLSEDVQKARRARGQEAVPPIAVVTRSDMDWASPFFTEAQVRPIVVTTSDYDRGAMSRGEKVADFVVAGDTRVDPARALEHLHRSGYRSVLLEGGPGLNADIVDAGLLDELCLTVSPRLVAGSGPRVMAGPELAQPLELDMVHLLEEDGLLFYRLTVARS